VIQRANTAQAQALSTQNQSVMSDTATAGYYQQLVQTSQSLLSQGCHEYRADEPHVGSNHGERRDATATTTETWLTTSATAPRWSRPTPICTHWSTRWQLAHSGRPAAIEHGRVGASNPWRELDSGDAWRNGAATADSTPGWADRAEHVAQLVGLRGNGWHVHRGQRTWDRSATGAQRRRRRRRNLGWDRWVSSRDLIQAVRRMSHPAPASLSSRRGSRCCRLPRSSAARSRAGRFGDRIDRRARAGTGAWQIVFKNNTSGQTYQTTVQYTSHSPRRMDRRSAGGSERRPALDNFVRVIQWSTAVQNSQTVDLPRPVGSRSPC